MEDQITDGRVSPAITQREPGRPLPRPSAAGVGATNRDSNHGNRDARVTAAPNDDQFRLPNALDKDYEVIQPLGGGGEADVFLVRNRISGDRRVAKVYRPGTPGKPGPQPKPEVLERIKRDNSPHLVRVEKYHIEDARSWELQEYIESTLEGVLAGMSKPVSSGWVRKFLEVLNPALEYLHSLEIEHRDLKPSNILVRTREPLSIVLSDFGIASVTMATLHFTNHVACTQEYAPPESTVGSGTTIVRTRWDYWSLGMMLVELLTGRHPLTNGGAASEDPRRRIQKIQFRLNGNTDDFVAGVTDPDWKKLCRGLLRRDANLRWGSKEVGRWLVNPADKRLTVAQETAPPNAARAAQSIRFLGKDHTQPETLADAFATNWEKAADYWRRDASYIELQHWLTHELGSPEHADVLAGIRKSGQTLDAQLFAVIQTLAPDRTPSFQGEALTAQNLRQLADTVMTSPSAVAKWLELDRHRILQIAGQKHAELASINQDQQHATAAYSACQQIVRENSQGTIFVPEPGALSDKDRAFLLAGVVPGSSVMYTEGERLRTEISIVSGTDSLAWVRSFNDVKNAQPAALLLMPAIAAAAQAETERARALVAFRVTKALWITLASLCISVPIVWILSAAVFGAKSPMSHSNFSLSILISYIFAVYWDSREADRKQWSDFWLTDKSDSFYQLVARAALIAFIIVVLLLDASHSLLKWLLICIPGFFILQNQWEKNRW